MTALSAESLTVRAADGAALLSEITLGVAPGETLLLCGPPGSGKTLLVKALAGLLEDRDDLALSGTVRRGDVGFVFQNPAIQVVRQTVYRDVAFGLENRGVPVPEIEERIEQYAEALDATDLLDRRTDALSRGETAIVALLGVLVTEPDAVILDEPLAALDRRNAALVIEAIDRLREADTTVVIAEHDARDLLSRVDRIGLLDDGRLRRRGAPSDLVEALHESGVKLPAGLEIEIEAGNPVGEVEGR